MPGVFRLEMPFGVPKKASDDFGRAIRSRALKKWTKTLADKFANTQVPLELNQTV